MKLFTPEIENQLKEIFSGLSQPVTIALFTQEENCPSCADTDGLLTELAALSDKLTLARYTLKEHGELAQKHHVTLAPGIVLLDAAGKDNGIRFSGIPAGHEINSFISALMEVSGAVSPMPEALAARIGAIQKPVDIKVFVTLGCPHCPGAVQKAHKLALMNGGIEAEMIEAQTFSELSDQYGVSSVPKIVINGTQELIGNQPLEAFLDAIEAL